MQSLGKNSTSSLTEVLSYKRTYFSQTMRSPQMSSLSRSSRSSWTDKFFFRILAPINLHLFSSNKLTVSLLHTPTKPLFPCMTSCKTPSTLSPYPCNPHPFPPINHNRLHTLPWLPPLINPPLLRYRNPPPPKTMQLNFPGTLYPTRNSPLVPPLLPSQSNIVVTVNGEDNLQTPAWNAAYLFYHPIYINKCASTTSIMDNLPKLPQHTPITYPYPQIPLPPQQFQQWR